MKLFFLLLFLGIAVPGFTQLTSGEVTYSTKQWVKYEDDPTRKDTTAETGSISVLFNEDNFLSTTKGQYYTKSYLFDRKTLKRISSSLSEDDKTVEIIDLDKLAKLGELNDWNDENRITFEVIEEPEKVDLEHFQKDLMQKIAKDTSLLFSSEAKNILGYNCQKMVVKIKNGKTSTIWFTSEIQGLNDLCNPYPSLIKGMVLKDSTETSRYISVSEVSAIKPGANLIENLRFKIPEGYVLFCGDVYLNNPNENLALNADVISFDESQPAMDVLATEINLAVRQSFKSENDLPNAYLALTLRIDEKGKVTEVVKSITSDYYYPDVDMKKLSAAIKKKCVFEPTLLYGTATVSAFTAMFVISTK
jgi:GLPGLI family protein